MPVPRRAFNERHVERLNLVGTRRLWERDCDECGAQMQSTIGSQRPECVLCEKCYWQAIYH